MSEIGAEAQDEMLVMLTADIVTAHVSHNSLSANDIAGLIQSVHSALASLTSPKEADESTLSSAKLSPKVSIRSSVKPDRITCLECGFESQMLRRHLREVHDLTPDQYRAKWQLRSDYPIVAPNYTQVRKDLALKNRLGRKPKQAITVKATVKRVKAKV